MYRPNDGLIVSKLMEEKKGEEEEQSLDYIVSDSLPL